MKISEADLTREVRAAQATWGVLIRAAELQHPTVPVGLLYAVGSRETNLSPLYTHGSTGDHGHGHGLWQLDDRSHSIPDRFDTNVTAQAGTAAGMLAGLNVALHDWVHSLAAYNAGLGAVLAAIAAGKNPDTRTTGGDYGADTWARFTFIRDHLLPKPPQPAEYCTVRSGDTLTSIARRYRTTVTAVVKLNRGIDANLIHPGQRIRVH
jgi:hypothetical protein